MAMQVHDNEGLGWIRNVDPVKVWEVLCRCAGASNSLRTQNHFVSCWTSDTGDWQEWRFGGNLGFGGKLWRERMNFPIEGHPIALRVDCYKEHYNEETKAIILGTNRGLLDILVKAGLRKEYE